MSFIKITGAKVIYRYQIQLYLYKDKLNFPLSKKMTFKVQSYDLHNIMYNCLLIRLLTVCFQIRSVEKHLETFSKFSKPQLWKILSINPITEFLSNV